MGPRSGLSCIDVEDLTKVEIESRRLMMKLLEFLQGERAGFEGAWVLQTAPQLGTRHSRRVVGVKKITRPEWLTGKVQEDEIGVYGGAQPAPPQSLLPARLPGSNRPGQHPGGGPQPLLRCAHARLRALDPASLGCWVRAPALRGPSPLTPGDGAQRGHQGSASGNCSSKVRSCRGSRLRRPCPSHRAVSRTTSNQLSYQLSAVTLSVLGLGHPGMGSPFLRAGPDLRRAES